MDIGNARLWRMDDDHLYLNGAVNTHNWSILEQEKVM